MKFDIFPDNLRTFKNLFIIFLVALSFGGGIFTSKLYFNSIEGKYEASKTTLMNEVTSLKESISSKELEHSKEVSNLRSDYEKQLKQKVVTEVAKDGSSKQVIETESNESQVVIKEVIKEVEVVKVEEKVVYVDRIVVQESFVSPASHPSWSLGFAIEPKINLPYFDNFNLELGYSLGENFDIFTSLDTDLTVRLGFRFRF